ncbi:MAG: transcription antiterminator [Eubacterium sp.]|nr:transcription antiterminator [Eubacterium sp.]
MFQYGRLNEIFHYIKKHDYISSERLASKFDVTERTIRNDIQEINLVLLENGAVIKLKRKYGYYIEITEDRLFGQFLEELEKENKSNMELETSKDRIRYILSLLLESDDYISLNEIMDKVFISKNTLNNYIKTIKKIIEKYYLEYIAKPNVGIKLIGTEDNKRKCIMDHVITYDFDNYITGFTKEERALFIGIDLDYLKEITLSQLKRRNIETSDYNIKNLIIHLALMISRVKQNNYINLLDIETDYSIMGIVESLCKDVEQYYDIIISKGEKIYIYLHFVANTHMEAADIDDEWLERSVQNILDIIYENYSFDLRDDEILTGDLFRHMKSIFINKSFGLNIRNPLINTIKNNYPLAFEITLTAISKVFTKQPFVLNEEDVGYVSVHIGAAIERYFAKRLEKKNVILVCGSGQATIRMLEARLNLYFSDKINIVRCISYNDYNNYRGKDFNRIDFVISTVPLESKIVPSITVNFALKNKDVESISRFINRINVKKEQKESAFFDEELFFRFHEVSNKESLIRILCDKLKEKGIVEDEFIDSVLEREELGNTNMNDVFALAHPMKLCARETKVAVAILDQPILWGKEETVKIVFLLAIKQGVQKDIEHLYDSFIKIVNDSKLQQKIIHSKDYNDFISTMV